MVKHTFFLLVLFVFLNSEVSYSMDNSRTKNESPGYVITVSTQGLTPGYLFLSRRSSSSWMNIDSVLVNPGTSASFKGSLDNPEMLYLRMENSGKAIAFFAENSTIEILPDFENEKRSQVKGSSANNEYRAYLASMADLEELKSQAYDQYREANKNGDQKKKEEAVLRFDEIASNEMERNRKFVSENVDSWVSPYIIRSAMVYTLSLNELKSLVNSLDSRLDRSVYVQQLNDHIAVLDKVDIGKKFTDFSLKTPGGEELSLSGVAGKGYLLVDFWASWCGPCRRENPNVVALYNDFKDKGFGIIGVSFDTDRENWLKAIEDDHLTWPHVSDLKGWGNAAGKLYGVNSIPHTVLLDPDGVIIAKNLPTEELRGKLEKLLGQ